MGLKKWFRSRQPAVPLPHGLSITNSVSNTMDLIAVHIAKVAVLYYNGI
ncbi:hypothetical protein CLOSTHATH_03816 [Hungatella hathewayi DSM 13479]|uniref:Uncharacterized protein n=1 Tax=Hungatella hathewayi DSM 13479 TaxID=566550 RepID=D3AJM5_9FIRM|nr:hypothetical protein CLOSTHATH_03816 [Hungatella hathewayi DSM 13479]